MPSNRWLGRMQKTSSAIGCRDFTLDSRVRTTDVRSGFRAPNTSSIRLISVLLLSRNVSQRAAVVVALAVLSCSLVGCLEPQLQEDGPVLSVAYEATNATIVDTYEAGEFLAQTPAMLSFNFEQTASRGTLSLFGVDRLDGQSSVSVDAETSNSVTMAFDDHGLHRLVLYAEDERGRSTSIITVRIELRIEWVETDTNEPLTMQMNTAPREGGVAASALFIESTVENPALIDNFGGGQDVDITWSLLDETHGTCQRNQASVDDGDSATWRTVHFNTVDTHELVVEYEGGQDTLDVHHRVNVLHEELESPPMP